MPSGLCVINFLTPWILLYNLKAGRGHAVQSFQRCLQEIGLVDFSPSARLRGSLVKSFTGMFM